MEDLIISPTKRRSGRLAAAGVAIAALLYAAALFADFLAPYDHAEQARNMPAAPPSIIRFRTAEGYWNTRPFVYARRLSDPLTRAYTENVTEIVELRFFTSGREYRFLGVVPTTVHLFGSASEEHKVNILGTDALGRDRFSRLLHAIRFSLFVSPLGTLAACILGILIGVTSGYAGRFADTVLMGAADAMMSLPTLILILAARAAFPLELPPVTAAFLLISIFALTGWAEMARLSRGLVVSARGSEYVLAAKASGLSGSRILFRHILPNISRPLITQATLMLPAFLLAEVALSFLGVGLQEPEPSLGNMLAAAGDLSLLASQPIALLSPAIVIFMFVLGIRLISRGKTNMMQ